MVKRLLFSYFIWIFISDNASAQNKGWGSEGYLTSNVGIAVGYSRMASNMLEVGIGFQPWDADGTMVGYPYAGFLAMYEHSLDRKLYGTSFTFWYLGGPFSFGLGFNRYSDFKNQTFGFKPMIGMSIFRVGIMFGYNIYLNENKVDGFYHPSFTVRYYLPVWKRDDE